MGMWGKLMVAAAAPLLLTACLWSPGKFTSELTLRKNGTFTLDYKGEILFQLPDEKAKPEPWSDDMARCISGGTSQTDVTEGETRECAPAEVAAMKAAHDKKEATRLESKRKNDDEMAKVFGLPGLGRYFVQGALNRDYPLVLGVVTLYAALIILFNLFADLIYGWLDPRMREG